jgi:hypothetical protein
MEGKLAVTVRREDEAVHILCTLYFSKELLGVELTRCKVVVLSPVTGLFCRVALRVYLG